QTNPMQQKPSGFLRDADGAMQLVGTDSVLSVGNQPKRTKPLVETDRRIFHDCPDLDRKLPFGVRVLALPNLARRKKGNVRRAASRTFHNAIRPAHEFNEGQRPNVVSEIADALVQSGREFGCFLFLHTNTLTEEGR